MPELSVSDEQLRRLEAVADDLEDAYVSGYGTVRPGDALEYLLDTYTPPGTDTTSTPEASGDADEEAAVEASEEAAEPPLEPEEPDASLTTIDGVGDATAESLADAGFPTLEAIREANPEALTTAEGVGSAQAIDIKAAVAGMDERPSGTADDAGGSSSPADRSEESPESTLQQAMSLLDAHDDRWRESADDEPYEVDLPDGSTEAVRTKDDVKRLLFKHWR